MEAKCKACGQTLEGHGTRGWCDLGLVDDPAEGSRPGDYRFDPEEDEAEQLVLSAADLLAEHGISVPEDPYAGLYGDEPTYNKTGGQW